MIAVCSKCSLNKVSNIPISLKHLIKKSPLTGSQMTLLIRPSALGIVIN